MTNLLEEFNRKQIQAMNRKIPEFRVGDTLKVTAKIDATSERTQVFEGVCISKRRMRNLSSNLHASFFLRKISYGESIVSQFFVYSPLLVSIEVIRLGKVRRAKLYYLCDLYGKAARIKERKIHIKTRSTE